VIKGGCLLVVTSRLGVIPMSLAFAMKDTGFIPVIVLMGATAKKRRSFIDTISEYGLGYTLERVVDALIRMAWLAGKRSLSRQFQIHEIEAHDWDALCQLADRLNALAIVSASFGYRFPSSVIERQKILLNLHPAPLPAWRGADPIYWMIRKREEAFGITLHQVAEKFDEGAIYFTEFVTPRVRYIRGFVELALSKTIIRCLGTWMLQIVRDDVVAHEQQGGVYWPLPTKANQKRLL